MPTVLRVLEYPVVEAVGWALLHFVWQALIVAGILAIVQIPLRRVSARIRYVAFCGAMGLLTLCPIATGVWTFSVIQSERSSQSRIVAPVIQPQSQESTVAIPDQSTGLAPVEISAIPELENNTLMMAEPIPGGISTEQPGRLALNSMMVTERPDLRTRLRQMAEFVLPWLVCAWCFGVVVLSIRLLAGWRMVLRIKRHATVLASNVWQERLARMSSRLCVTQSIRLVESTLVNVPTVIGWMRPVILLPLTAMTGLDPSQLEALLAHEIAHVRRHDFLVNLVQTAIETLLFYHPVVWWISRRIREEREHCCDDLAVEVCGNHVTYARALASMEELRSSPGLTLAADGGSLLGRIRRLVCPPSEARRSPWGASLIAISLVGLLCAGIYISSQSEAASFKPGDATGSSALSPAPDSSGNQESLVVADSQELESLDEAKGVSVDVLDSLTPAKIADQIEATMKQFAHVEYSAETADVRDANGFQPQKEPLLIAGPGKFLFRSDGTRWLADEEGFTINLGQQESVARHEISGFDGEKHFIIGDRSLVIGENDLAVQRLAPREIFWKGAKTSNWLLYALRHFSAKIARRAMLQGHECVVVESEPGKPKPGEKQEPGFDPTIWQYEITISPNQSWLPVQTRIKLNGQPYSTETLSQVTRTADGTWYPGQIAFVNWKRGDTQVSRDLRITAFSREPKFENRHFQRIDPLPWGVDIVDHRVGHAWHNDVWWPEISKWLSDKLDWPRADLIILSGLRSFADGSLDGKPAPEIQVGEWIAGTDLAPANIASPKLNERTSHSFWNWPNRKVTVVFFYGGDAINPTPGWMAGLKGLQERYGPLGLDVICITTPTTDRGNIERAIKSLGIKFPVAIDTATDPSDKSGNHYGKTFHSFGLQAYVGAVVIDPQGTIRQITDSTAEKGYSPLEAVVRRELAKIDAKALNRSDRLLIARRLAFDLTGKALSEADAELVIAEVGPAWATDFAKRFMELGGATLQALMERNELSLEEIVNDVVNQPFAISTMTHNRISDEWRRQRAAVPGKVSLALEILLAEGLRDQFMDVNPALESVVGARVHVKAIPQLRFLSSNTPGGWFVISDRKATVETDTDSDGRGALPGLRKGTYEITITAPGLATVEKLVTIPTDDSKIGAGWTIHQAAMISGTVTDSQGTAIAGAKVTAKLRHHKPSVPRITTTAHLPRIPVTTDEQGQFSLQELYDGAYTFEVSAEGYQTLTVQRIPAGRMAQVITLLKVGEQARPQAIKKQKVRTTFLGGKNKIPLEGVKVTVRRDLDQSAAIRAQSNTELVTEILTNADGSVEFEAVPGRLLFSVAASKELPYLEPFGRRWAVVLTSNADQSPATYTFTLADACELTLRAVDVETGKGIPGVKFGTENAPGEYWLQVVVPECLGASRPVRGFSPQDPVVPNEKDYESDAEGNYRVLIGPRPGWKYMLYSIPMGFEAADNQAEVEIDTPAGSRVTHTFKLRRKIAGAARGSAGTAPVAKDDSTDLNTSKSGEPKSTRKFDTHPIRIRGRAMDRNNQPVSGAQVYLVSAFAGNQRIADTTTDASGNFEFIDARLPMRSIQPNELDEDLGAFELVGLPPDGSGLGYAWQPTKWYRKSADLNLPDGTKTASRKQDPPNSFRGADPIHLDLQFSPSAMLKGRVTDEQGRPVAGAQLKITNCMRLPTETSGMNSDTDELTAIGQWDGFPTEIKQRLSNQQGQFEFTELPPESRFTVSVIHQDFAEKSIFAATVSRELGSTANGPQVQTGDLSIVVAKAREIPIRVVYADSGKPAGNVFVGAGSDSASTSEVTDAGGNVKLRLPVGTYRLALFPERGTPYLAKEDVGELIVTDSVPKEAKTLRLERGCVLEATIADAETGKGIPDVDLWILPGGAGEQRIAVEVQSWDPETQQIRSDLPTTDRSGLLRAVVEPGTHRFGTFFQRFDFNYTPERAGQLVPCPVGQTVRISFQLMKSTLPPPIDPDIVQPEVKVLTPTVRPDSTEGANQPMKSGDVAADDQRPVATSQQEQPPLEFRFVVSEKDPKDDTVLWFPIAKSIIPNAKKGPDLNLKFTRREKEIWQALLWNTPEHALVWDDKWGVEKCEVVPDPGDPTKRFSIEVQLDEAGGNAFRKLTQAHLKQKLAIVIDGEIVMAPVVQDSIGAKFVVTGNFSKADAEGLAAVIRKVVKGAGKPINRRATINDLDDVRPRTQLASLDQATREQAEEKRVTLDDIFEVNAIDKPLQEILQELATSRGMRLEFDQVALNELNVSRSEPCNLVITGIRARNVLKLLLEPHQLGYSLSDGVLRVTSLKRIEQQLETRLFQIGSDGLRVPDEHPQISIDAQGFSSLFYETVLPDDWDITGRAADRAAISIVEDGKSLSIRQTRKGHDQWYRLLSELRSGGRGREAERIGKGLRKRVTVEFNGSPLNDVLRQLKEALDANIVMAPNQTASGRRHVLLKAQEQPLYQAMKDILDPLDLTFFVQNEVLMVAPKPEIQQQFVPHVYRIAFDTKAVGDLIQARIAPTTWQQRGGPGRMHQIDKSNLLVVYHNEIIHTAIGLLLQDLAEAQSSGVQKSSTEDSQPNAADENDETTATQAGVDQKTSDATRTAIGRGIAFLKSQQKEDGTWPDPGAQTNGVTAMVTAALLQAGVKPEDPTIQKALTVLRKNELAYIYTVALETIVFCLASPQEDAELIRKHIDWIEKAQVTEGPATGGWSYQARSGQRADGSCSRFAILGLHAAQNAGFKIQLTTWQRVNQYWLDSQDGKGQWGYMPNAPATTSMTLAGIASLATANQFLPVNDQANVRVDAIQRGIGGIDAEISRIPKSNFPFYTLHCLERAGQLTRIQKFGAVDWKAFVVRQLLDGQQDDGAWLANTGGFGGGPTENQLIATSFALMILSGK